MLLFCKVPTGYQVRPEVYRPYEPPPALEPVWNGEKGHYLTLPGYALQSPPEAVEPEIPLPVVGKVIEFLRSVQAVNSASIEHACHLSGSTTQSVLEELLAVGVVRKVQQSLFELDAQRGELYALVGE